MPTREARQLAIKRAAEMVRSGNPFVGRASDPAATTVKVGGDLSTRVPSVPYFYLAGPMTGYPQFNFPEFERVTAKLRSQGYVICPPHEMEDNLVYHAASECPDGNTPELASTSPLGFTLLRRDANIVMHPNCVGVIAMPGWEKSFGAGQIEMYLADRFKKQTLVYCERGDEITLVTVRYKEAMAHVDYR